MAVITWLHLSDWHQSGEDYDRSVVLKALLKDVEQRRNISPDLATLDFIFFTGDLACHGMAEEYEAAQRNLLTPLLELTGTDKERMFVIPGNHDIDRGAFDLLPAEILKPITDDATAQKWLREGNRRNGLLGPFTAYQQFVTTYGLPGFGAFGSSVIVSRSGVEVGVVGCNSALMCGRNKDDHGTVNDLGYLTVGEMQVRGSLDAIAYTDLRIALIHHPFHWLSEFDRHRIERLIKERCEFILRGHEHVANVEITHNANDEYVCIPGGATYDRRDPVAPIYVNSYNFVRCDTDTGHCTIYMRCLNRAGDKWIRDHEQGDDGTLTFQYVKRTDPEPAVTLGVSNDALITPKSTVRASPAPALDGFEYDVFLSHNSLDKPVVRALAERLRADGIRVWLDEWVIQAGDVIGIKVEEGLERSRVLVLFMSQNSFGSGWASLERHTFIFRDPANSRRQFVPVLLEDCKIPDILAQFKYVDYRQKSDDAYHRILDACRMQSAIDLPLKLPSSSVKQKTGSVDDVVRSTLEARLSLALLEYQTAAEQVDKSSDPSHRTRLQTFAQSRLFDARRIEQEIKDLDIRDSDEQRLASTQALASPQNQKPDLPQQSPLKVFLSYAREDMPSVRRLHDDLQQSGIEVWVDFEDLLPGQDWKHEIQRAVRNTDVVLICVSRSSTSRSGFFNMEIAHALEIADKRPEGSIFVIPVRLDSSEVPPRLAAWHWLNYYEQDGHALLLRSLSLRAIDLGRRRPVFTPTAIAPQVEALLLQLHADSILSIESAMDRVQWPQPESVGVPHEFVFAIPQFIRIARTVGQYGALYNAFRKREALETAIQGTDRLQGSLKSARGPFALQLLSVADGWRSVLDREYKVLQEDIESSSEIPNPFAFGDAIEEDNPTVFAGRKDIVNQIERAVLGSSNMPMLLLHGPRRMGKTSVLKQLPRLLGNKFTPVTIDCQYPGRRESLASLLSHLSQGLADGVATRGIKIEPIAADTLLSEPFGHFETWLDSVLAAMPAKTRVLICLDEYDRLQDIVHAGWGASFLDALRHILQHRRGIGLMFTGVHTFSELGPAWTDRFISARSIRVGLLRPEEVRPLLTNPIPEFDMTYRPGALERLMAETNGQPFLTQAVAWELVEHMNVVGRKDASVDDVETAISAALISADAYFSNVWTDAGAEGQAILKAIAHSEKPASLCTAFGWLRNHDVLTPDNAFTVPIVERWVRQKQ